MPPAGRRRRFELGLPERGFEFCLLHGHADVIQVHVSQVPVSILMIVKVDADGLALVRGQIVVNLRPGVRVGTNLHNLRQDSAGAVLHLRLLPVVGDRVGRRWPVPESQSGLGCGPGYGDRLGEG